MVLEWDQELVPSQHVVAYLVELPEQLHVHRWVVPVWRVVCAVQLRDVQGGQGAGWLHLVPRRDLVHGDWREQRVYLRSV